MSNSLKQTLKNAMKWSLRRPVTFAATLAGRYAFVRSIIQSQPWLAEERNKELEQLRYTFDLAYQQRLRKEYFLSDPERMRTDEASEAFHAFQSRRPASPFLFVVGSGSSGTTIMLRVLSDHPDVYTIPEETVLFGGPSDRCVMNELFSWEERSHNENKSVILEKTPNHLFCFNRINEFLPNCKFICMMRDPRDIVASLMRRACTFDGAILGLSRYLRQVDEMRAKCANHILVRLEDLTGRPQQTVSRILSFAGMRSTPDIVRSLVDYHRKPKTFYTGEIAKPENNVGANTPRMRDYQINQPLFNDSGRWLTEIPEESHAQLHVKLRYWLEQYGYLESSSDSDDTSGNPQPASRRSENAKRRKNTPDGLVTF
jgi:hypothetical protein